MELVKIYNIFISHAWKHSDEYERLVRMLNGAPRFRWKNFSVPECSPLLDIDDEHNRDALFKELAEQIRPVHCVVVLAGMYVNHSYWIKKEIEIAERYGKPVIGVKPWGREKVPTFVKEKAKAVVGWHTDSVVKAIKRYSL